MQYTRYTISLTGKPEGLAPEDAFDLIASSLADLGFDSFEHQDDILLAYIPCDDDREGLLEGINEELPFEGLSINYEREIMPDVNWNEEWEKNYFQPIIIGDNLCQIRAPFHESSPDVQTEIIISPKMAFGTGNHETTALMMSYILEHDVEGLRVLDMGCGTGILGILALKQGARELSAIDIDEWAYLNVLENAALNGVEGIDSQQGDASSLNGREPYDLILANITRNILLQDMEAYTAVLKPGGRLILSGFYLEDVDSLTSEGQRLGLSLGTQESRNKWTRLELIKD